MAFIFFCICLMQEGHAIWHACGDEELRVARDSRNQTEAGFRPLALGSLGSALLFEEVVLLVHILAAQAPTSQKPTTEEPALKPFQTLISWEAAQTPKPGNPAP